MKNLSITYIKKFIPTFLISLLSGQEPFLDMRPYVPPSFEQYPASNCVDHHYPTTNQEDNVFLRFDGVEFTDDLIYPDCLTGSSCYDGHAGIDYFMPLNTPIIAPADGYVLWSSFSSPADPCPGGIAPNGDQGTIILAHGNDYFTVYLHMMPPLNVNVGDNVATGDTLGFTGNTGCAINSHLHFEVRKGSHFFDPATPYAVDPFGWWHNAIDPVEQFRGNKSEWLWTSTTLVDDGDNGFERFQGPDWSYLNFGYNNDCWVSPAVQSDSESRHYAIWVPYLEQGGEFDIEIFIPSGVDAASEAIYEISIKDTEGISQKTNVAVNQNSSQGSFHPISSIYIPSGSRCSVILRDIVGSSSTGSFVVFDAVRFNPISASNDYGSVIVTSENLFIHSVFPNPFNNRTEIVYETSLTDDITISIFNNLGQKVVQSKSIEHPKGYHSFVWDGKSTKGQEIASGVYFFSITSAFEQKTKKLVYLK